MVLRTAIEMSRLSGCRRPSQSCRTGISDRQRQNLLVEFEDCLGMAYCNRKQVSGQLTDTGATLRCHLAQTGVNDRGGTYFDLLAIAFVRLGHAVILSQREACTWYRHAVARDVFVTVDAWLSSRRVCTRPSHNLFVVAYAA